MTDESWLATGKALRSLTLGPPYHRQPTNHVHLKQVVGWLPREASKQRQGWEGAVWVKGERKRRIKTRTAELNSAVSLRDSGGFNKLAE